MQLSPDSSPQQRQLLDFDYKKASASLITFATSIALWQALPDNSASAEPVHSSDQLDLVTVPAVVDTLAQRFDPPVIANQKIYIRDAGLLRLLKTKDRNGNVILETLTANNYKVLDINLLNVPKSSYIQYLKHYIISSSFRGFPVHVLLKNSDGTYSIISVVLATSGSMQVSKTTAEIDEVAISLNGGELVDSAIKEGKY